MAALNTLYTHQENTTLRTRHPHEAVDVFGPPPVLLLSTVVTFAIHVSASDTLPPSVSRGWYKFLYCHTCETLHPAFKQRMRSKYSA